MPAEGPADETLIQSALDGSDDAFAELALRHKHRVFGIAARFARHAHELDDVCQEIFIRAHRNLAKFRGEAPFEHWLSRIAIRACYDLLRRTRHEREQLSLDENPVTYETLPDAHSDETARHARELLARAMAELAPDAHLVLTLLELEEKTVKEIAEATGWSESNVKVRAHRAREALRAILKQQNAIP